MFETFRIIGKPTKKMKSYLLLELCYFSEICMSLSISHALKLLSIFLSVSSEKLTKNTILFALKEVMS